jgi:ATP-dependent DNA ligase
VFEPVALVVVIGFCGLRLEAPRWRLVDNCHMAMITPMLAAAGPLPPDSARWGYEVKWVGFRAFVRAVLRA